MNHKIVFTNNSSGSRNFSCQSRPLALSTMSKRPSPLNSTPCTATGGEDGMNSTSDYSEKRKKFHHNPSWNVASRTSSLPSIPFLHVHSPTCVLFLNITDPNIIANAVVNVVTSLSSIGNYDDKYACAIIHSMTNSKISIHMYKYPDTKNDASCGVMLEFDRLKGDTIEFHRTIKTITTHVRSMVSKSKEGQSESDDGDHKGVTVVTTPYPSSPPRPILKRAKQELSHVRSVSLDHDSLQYDYGDSRSHSIFVEAMQNVDTLIHKDRLDAVELGMQSLSLLTSSSKFTSSSVEDVMTLAAKAILIDSHGTWQNVRDFIFGLVMDEARCEDEDFGEQEGEEMDKRLRLSLSILANALETALKYKNEFIPFMDRTELKQILSTMAKYMKQMTMTDESIAQALQLQVAYQAARCISSLIQMTPELKVFALDLGILKLAQDGVNIGACRHSMIGTLSDRIVSSLSVISK